MKKVLFFVITFFAVNATSAQGAFNDSIVAQSAVWRSITPLPNKVVPNGPAHTSMGVMFQSPASFDSSGNVTVVPQRTTVMQTILYAWVNIAGKPTVVPVHFTNLPTETAKWKSICFPEGVQYKYNPFTGKIAYALQTPLIFPLSMESRTDPNTGEAYTVYNGTF